MVLLFCPTGSSKQCHQDINLLFNFIHIIIPTAHRKQTHLLTYIATPFVYALCGMIPMRCTLPLVYKKTRPTSVPLFHAFNFILKSNLIIEMWCEGGGGMLLILRHRKRRRLGFHDGKRCIWDGQQLKWVSSFAPHAYTHWVRWSAPTKAVE